MTRNANEVPTSGPMVRIDADAPQRTASPKPASTSATATSARPAPIAGRRRPFYDLERWSGYNDPLLVVGWLVVCGGVGMLNVPAAVVLLGVGMCALAWMMGRGK